MAKAFDFKKAVAAVQAEIDTLRGEISTLKAERDDLQNGPMSADETLAHLGQIIDQHASLYVEALQGQLAEVTQGGTANFAPFVGMTEFGHPKNAAIGLICLLLGNEMKTRLGDVLKAQLGDNKAPSSTERAKRLKTIEARLLELERNEESLICEAEVAGIEVFRRPDADPRAVLEISET